MRKVQITELSQSVRQFVDQVQDGAGIVVQDEQGRARWGVIAYQEATPERKEEGLARH